MPGQTDGHALPQGSRAVSRREFLARAGLAGLGAALFQLPSVLRGRGWLDEASAQQADLTRDTMSGLAAFVVPGPDPYSVAQGESSPTPGGNAARAPDHMIELFDVFVAAPDLGPFSNDETVPVSGAVANMLNTIALQVDPAAAGGPFPSHFSRLSIANKAEVFRVLAATEGEDDGARTIRFLAGALPIFAGFCSYNEWHAFDPETGTLRHRPLGWDLSHYAAGLLTASDGWPELRGYYKGRRRARS